MSPEGERAQKAMILERVEMRRRRAHVGALLDSSQCFYVWTTRETSQPLLTVKLSLGTNKPVPLPWREDFFILVLTPEHALKRVLRGFFIFWV